MVDDSLKSGIKSGYQFVSQNVSTDHFELVAVPQAVGSSGHKGFYVDGSGVIRYSTDGSYPDSTSSPIEN